MEKTMPKDQEADAEITDGYCSAKVHAISPEGFWVQWQVREKNVNELFGAVCSLTGWLSQPDEQGRVWSSDNFGAPRQPVPAPQVAARPAVPAAPAVQQPTQRTDTDPTKAHACMHGAAVWQQPGVSQRTGKPYAGFWKCAAGVQGCKVQLAG